MLDSSTYEMELWVNFDQMLIFRCQELYNLGILWPKLFLLVCLILVGQVCCDWATKFHLVSLLFCSSALQLLISYPWAYHLQIQVLTDLLLSFSTAGYRRQNSHASKVPTITSILKQVYGNGISPYREEERDIPGQGADLKHAEDRWFEEEASGPVQMQLKVQYTSPSRLCFYRAPQPRLSTWGPSDTSNPIYSGQNLSLNFG